jgi:hydrogenase maturation protease
VSTTTVKPVLVVCVGNSLAGDDAFAPQVAEILRLNPPQNTQIVELGTAPASLVDLLHARKALIVVDAASCPDRPPGQLLDCDWDFPERGALHHHVNLTTHDLSLADQIELARALHLLPPIVRLLAVNISAAQLGSPMTPAVAAQVPLAAQRIAIFASELRRRDAMRITSASSF